MRPSELSLLSDTRLSREARMMGLHLASKGEGEHEVSHDEFRLLLGRGARGMATDSTLAGYVQELTAHGWVARRPGGRGSPFYAFTPPPSGGKGYPSTPTWEQGKALPPSQRGVKTASTPLPGRGRPHVVVVEEEVVVGVGGARANLYDLDERAIEVMDEPGPDGVPHLEGCRGSLRDYLAARVPTECQHAYVRSIQAWLQGSTGAPRGLFDVPDPVHLLATALNDLGTEDETTFKSGRGQVGVIANLRVKVEHLIRSGKAIPTRSNGVLFPEAV